MVELYVGSKSVEESNLFLRKLWGELNAIEKNGWHYYPYRESNKASNTITIGKCNLGEVSFTYKKKGCIDTIYIDTEDVDGAIASAMTRTLDGYLFPDKYYISAELTSKHGVCIAPLMSRNVTFGDIEGEPIISFHVDAFSELDIHHILANKFASIAYVLSVYTRNFFDIRDAKYCVKREKTEITQYYYDGYKYEWIDYDEIPSDDLGRKILPTEAVELINNVIENDIYSTELQLILNSAQQFYWSSYLANEVHDDPMKNRPGYLDIVNSMVVSALEPISNVGAPPPENCECCGNLKYSIVRKISDLTGRYLPQYISTDISKRIYKNRSAFLHTGTPMTYEHYFGSTFPLIDPVKKNEMIGYVRVEYNAIDYVAYVFRKLVVDYMNPQNEEAEDDA